MPFTLYKSSAGSGKTYTLVKEYLKITLKDPEENFKHILASTFTNKAAAEMKGRIIAALRELHHGRNVTLQAELARELPGVDIGKNSGILLKKLLHSYSDFTITTIDSFIYRIVRAFAVQLGIQPDFEVELNTDLILKKNIDSLLSKVGIDRDITSILIEFALSNIDQDRDWNIEKALFSVGKEIIGPNEKCVSQIEPLSIEDFEELIRESKGEVSRYQNFMNSRAEKALKLISESGLMHDDFAYSGQGTITYLERLRTARKPDELLTGTRFRKEEWYTKTTLPDKVRKIRELFDNGLENIRKEIVSFEKRNFCRFSSCYHLLKTIYAIAALKEIKEHLERYKKENRIIFISDFNSKVEKLLEKQTIPFIYSVAGDRYHHYLIDEFQDTSKAQWKNIYPLIEESLSVDNFNMAVGDSKQAIYRWRGGDWEIIEDRIEEFRRISCFAKSELRMNFRSLREIVEFNNCFFVYAARLFPGPLQKIYDQTKLKQDTCEPHRDGGHVRVEFIRKQKGEKGNRQKAIERVLEIISVLRENCFNYRDIAILVRYNKEGSIIADALFEKSIPIISPDSLLLLNEPVINFLISILTFIAKPSDRISLAHMFYYYYLAGITDKEVQIKRIQEIERYLDLSFENEEIGGIAEIIRRRKTLQRQPLYDIVEAVIRILRLNSSPYAHLSGYLQGFLDIVLEFSLRQNGDIELFLEWWEEHKDKASLSMSEEKDAVRIMTIHKAKGLQFPVTIIPFADWKVTIKPSSLLWLSPDPPLFEMLNIPFLVNSGKSLDNSLFSEDYRSEKDRSIIDNMNLLYVAFTRAQERMYIITTGDDQKGKKDSDEGITTISQIIRNVVERMIDVPIEGDKIITFGPSHTRRSEEKRDPGVPEHREIDKFISEPWWKRITIRRISETEKSQKVQWGNIIHNALSRIRNFKEPGNEVERVIREMMLEGLIGQQKTMELQNKLLSILALEDVRHWFDPHWEVKAESTIITARENIRPDRVIVSGTDAVVIDYKTGKEEPGHKRQLKAYEIALQKMGYTDVKSYILYIDQRKIIRV